MARYCDPDANVQSGERFAEQSMLDTPLPRLSTDSIGGLSSPTVNWNHTRLRLQNLVFCGANACSDRKVMQLAGRYFGGDMARPNRAALDPGFYLFHAYIDLLFERWLMEHGPERVTSTKTYLRATQPDSVPLPNGGGQPNDIDSSSDSGMGQVDLYLDTSSLGYEYEVSPDDEPLTRNAVASLLGDGTTREAVFGVSRTSITSRLLAGGQFSRMTSPDFVKTLKLEIPETAIDPSSIAYRATFSRNPSSPDVSYQMDVYMYPSDAPFDPSGEAFSAKYLAGIGSYWGTGLSRRNAHGERPSNDTFSVDVTSAVADLADPDRADRGGEIWNISIAITVLLVGQTFGDASFAPMPR